MCVQTKGFPWERPAVLADIPILSARFPSADFHQMLEAMSEYGFHPLTADLVLLGAALESIPDECGIRYLPFVGLDRAHHVLVKTDDMIDIVGWMENTALGYRMWRSASEWTERTYGLAIEFTMDCGCDLVPLSAYENGSYEHWLTSFNESRSAIFGRSDVIWGGNGLNTDITASQHLMWRRIREALSALPAYDEESHSLAA